METVTTSIKFPVDIYQNDGVFIAKCTNLGVITQGQTRVEAKENMLEAISLFIETCIEMDTIEAVLKECQ